MPQTALRAEKPKRRSNHKPSTPKHKGNRSRNGTRHTSTARGNALKQLNHLHSIATASSSQSSYTSGQRRFTRFCRNIKASPIPASKTTVALFAAALSRTLAPSSIKVYLAGVSLLHRRAGFLSPTCHNPALQLALRGICRQHSTQKKERKPITQSMLNRILAHPQDCHKWCHHDRLMLSAALSLAFYGFLQASEFTAPSEHSFNPHKHLTTQDLTISSKKVLFNIKRSKTDQTAQGHTITLHATGGKLCPVRLIITYHEGNQNSRKNQPLFTRKQGKPLTPSWFRRTLKTLLAHLGYDASQYNTHSLRIGAATSAAEAGISTKTIKRLGRWRSQTYRRYIHTNTQPAYK